MKKTALVIMAAGLGSRFGKGIKQLAKVGPAGEIIMEYSIHDALEAGFNKVVFIIRKDIEKEFKEIIGDKIEKITEVAYVYQELKDLPEGFTCPEDRTKPWGTGQAVLAAKKAVQEPFLVINADDYYGKEAYQEAYRYLTQEHPQDPMPICMVGFILKNTLSDNGGVTRGVCQIKDGQLVDIVETHNIEKLDGKAVVEGKEIDLDSAVSMNMWGLYPEFIEMLGQGFKDFLEETPSDNLKAEYLLPTIIGDLLHSNKAKVTALKSHDEWFGVTYKEDKDYVKENIQLLVEKGVYPQAL